VALFFVENVTFAPNYCNMSNNGQPGIPKPKYSMTDDIAEQLKAMAKKLPATCEEYNIINMTSGADLLNQGVLEVKKGGLVLPVEIGQMYEVPSIALRNLNHNLKLRKFYYAQGIVGIVEYFRVFPEYLITMQGQYPSLWKNGTYIGVNEGTQMPIDPTWLRKMEAMKQMQSQINQQ